MATTRTIYRRENGAYERETPKGYEKRTLNIIKDPVTGNRYARDLSDSASTYAPYTEPEVSTAAVTPTPGSTSTALLPTGGATAATSDPMDAFNKLSLDLLNSVKGVNTADLLKKKRLLEREALARTAQPTPRNLRTLSPGQQASIRSGSTSALAPEADQNAYEIEKAEQQIDNFFTIMDKARTISQDYAEKMAPPTASIEAMVKVIAAAPDQFDRIFASLNQKGQAALVDALAAGNVSLTDPLEKKYKEAQIRATNALADERYEDGEEGANEDDDGPGLTTDVIDTSPGGTKQAKQEGERIFREGLTENGQVVYNGQGPDGYVDPGAYLYVYSRWPGTDQSFLSAFPTRLVNPSSHKLLPASIRPKSGRNR